jgi:antitoxin MazE
MGLKTSIRRIGNSRGVILPAAVLEEVGATVEFSLTVKGGRIVLEPIRELRKGWFGQGLPEKADVQERDWEGASLSDDSEWQWE